MLTDHRQIQARPTPVIYVVRRGRIPEVKIAAAVASALSSGTYLPVVVPWDAGSDAAAVAAALSLGDYMPIVVPLPALGDLAAVAASVASGNYSLVIVPAGETAAGEASISAVLSSRSKYELVVVSIENSPENCTVAAALDSGAYA